MAEEEKKAPRKPGDKGAEPPAPPADAAEEPRSCQHTDQEIEEARKRWEKAHPKKD